MEAKLPSLAVAGFGPCISEYPTSVHHVISAFAPACTHGSARGRSVEAGPRVHRFVYNSVPKRWLCSTVMFLFVCLFQSRRRVLSTKCSSYTHANLKTDPSLLRYHSAVADCQRMKEKGFEPHKR